MTGASARPTLAAFPFPEVKSKIQVKRAQPDRRCSFCQKGQDTVQKLISSPSDYPRAYICDECVAVCQSILADDAGELGPCGSGRGVGRQSAGVPVDLPAGSEDLIARQLRAVEAVDHSVAAINLHDASRIAALMTDDHVLVDSLGYRAKGAAAMEAGDFFVICPDYWICTHHVAVAGDVVLAVGEAGGTIDGVAWRTPAAWKAVVREGKLAEWRVYADSKPVSEILDRRR